MKKIFVLLLTIALVVVMVGAAFTAAFSDVEQSTGNTLTAGTLNLTINGADGKAAEEENLTVESLKPGDSGTARCWAIRNNGSIAGNLWFEITEVVNVENDLLEMETDAGDTTANEGELGSQLMGTWKFRTSDEAEWQEWAPRYIDDMPNTPFGKEGFSEQVLGVLGQDESVEICLDYEFVSTEGNENNKAQGDGVQFNVVFHLEQENVLNTNSQSPSESQ